MFDAKPQKNCELSHTNSNFTYFLLLPRVFLFITYLIIHLIVTLLFHNMALSHTMALLLQIPLIQYSTSIDFEINVIRYLN